MKILVATDGSDQADLGVDLVAGIAWPDPTEIVAIEVVPSGAGLFGGPWPAIAIVEAEAIETEIRLAAERTVEAARSRLAGQGRDVRAAVLSGRAASAIVDEARRMAADLIVLGSRGHGAIERMLLGSISAEVVDHAPTPVLIARGTTIERVVLAWDGSPGARLAADLVRDWPVFSRSAVRIVSIADVRAPWWTGLEPATPEVIEMYVETGDSVRAHRDELTREMEAELRAAGLAAVADRREGDAAGEIIAAADSAGADLIVMGTHGRTGLARLVIGSVARNVVRHATCSVLVAPDRADRPNRNAA